MFIDTLFTMTKLWEPTKVFNYRRMDDEIYIVLAMIKMKVMSFA